MTLYLFGGITILFENGYTHVQYMRYICAYFARISMGLSGNHVVVTIVKQQSWKVDELKSLFSIKPCFAKVIPLRIFNIAWVSDSK